MDIFFLLYHDSIHFKACLEVSFENPRVLGCKAVMSIVALFIYYDKKLRRHLKSVTFSSRSPSTINSFSALITKSVEEGNIFRISERWSTV